MSEREFLPPGVEVEFDFGTDGLAEMFGVSPVRARDILVDFLRRYAVNQMRSSGYSEEEIAGHSLDRAEWRITGRLYMLRLDAWKDFALVGGRNATQDWGEWEELVIGDKHPAHGWDLMPEHDRQEAKRIWRKAREGQ